MEKRKEKREEKERRNGRKKEGEEFIFPPFVRHMTRRNREVVDFTRSRVKNNSKLTNLMKISRIKGYNGK